MIKIENMEIHGWEPAIRGMRNPMNSWEKSDSVFGAGDEYHDILGNSGIDYVPRFDVEIEIGKDDHRLMMNLANGGPAHAKYRRMIVVYMDITAPLYWWKEFDTYKVGTVANSCSTMHKIADKEFTLDDFSCEHLMEGARETLSHVVDRLNYWRKLYSETNDKSDWWQMIQLLPSSYNQKRTVMLNYEVLSRLYFDRKYHKLDEWRKFCEIIDTLPYSEIITCGEI